jgi:hypothetical protein
MGEVAASEWFYANGSTKGTARCSPEVFPTSSWLSRFAGLRAGSEALACSPRAVCVCIVVAAHVARTDLMRSRRVVGSVVRFASVAVDRRRRSRRCSSDPRSRGCRTKRLAWAGVPQMAREGLRMGQRS